MQIVKAANMGGSGKRATADLVATDARPGAVARLDAAMVKTE